MTYTHHIDIGECLCPVDEPVHIPSDLGACSCPVCGKDGVSLSIHPQYSPAYVPEIPYPILDAEHFDRIDGGFLDKCCFMVSDVHPETFVRNGAESVEDIIILLSDFHGCIGIVEFMSGFSSFDIITQSYPIGVGSFFYILDHIIEDVGSEPRMTAVHIRYKNDP